jgi:hypothetical protein
MTTADAALLTPGRVGRRRSDRALASRRVL